jgi:hypothetical protein
MGQIQLGLQELPNLQQLFITVRIEGASICEWICDQLNPAFTGLHNSPPDSISSLETITFIIVPPTQNSGFNEQHSICMVKLFKQLSRLRRGPTLPKLKTLEIRYLCFDKTIPNARDRLSRGAFYRRRAIPVEWDASIWDVLRPLEENGVEVRTCWVTSQKSPWYTSVAL